MITKTNLAEESSFGVTKPQILLSRCEQKVLGGKPLYSVVVGLQMDHQTRNTDFEIRFTSIAESNFIQKLNVTSQLFHP